MKKNIFSTFLGASLLLVCLTLSTKFFGFTRELIYAHYFGASKQFDVFLTAIALPVVINSVTIYFAQNYFIPMFNVRNKVSRKNGELFFTESFWQFIIGGLVVAIVLFLFSESILKIFINSVVASKVKLLYDLFILTIPLSAGLSIMTSYCQANFKYSFPAFSQFTASLLFIPLLLLLVPSLSTIGVSITFVVSYTTQFIILAILIRIKFSKKLFSFNIKKLNKIQWDIYLFLILIIEVMNLSIVLIDRYFLGYVDEGGISSLNYATQVGYLPTAILTLALSSTLFPIFSKLYVNKDFTLLKKIYEFAIIISLIIFIPLGILIYFYSFEIISLLFARGQFTEESILLTASILKYFSAIIILQGFIAINNKLIYGLSLIKQLFVISIVAFGLKILLNIVLVKGFKQNGLILSTGLSQLFICSSYFLLIIFKFNFKKSLVIYKLILVLLIISVAWTLSFQILPLLVGVSKLIKIVSFILFFSTFILNAFYDVIVKRFKIINLQHLA